MMGFKMAGMLDCREPDYWPMCRFRLWSLYQYDAKIWINYQIMA